MAKTHLSDIAPLPQSRQRAETNLAEEVELGLELADKGTSISEHAIDQWMNSPDDTPFPDPDTFE